MIVIVADITNKKVFPSRKRREDPWYHSYCRIHASDAVTATQGINPYPYNGGNRVRLFNHTDLSADKLKGELG